METFVIRARIAHTGEILSNISVFLVLFGVFGLFSLLTTGLLIIFPILFWFFILVFSLGTAALKEGFLDFPKRVTDFSDAIRPMMETLAHTAPYAILIGGVLAVASAFFLVAEPSSKKPIWRIAFSACVAVFAAICFLAVKLTEFGV